MPTNSLSAPDSQVTVGVQCAPDARWVPGRDAPAHGCEVEVVDEQAAPGGPHPGTSPVKGVRPELLAALVLRRASRGGVAKAGDIFLDYGFRMGSYLTGTFTELIEDGLLALAEENCGLRRVQVTDAGQARYMQLRGLLSRDRR